MRDDDDDYQACVGVGSCHELVSAKPKRVRRKTGPIGFLQPFIERAKKPTKPKARRAHAARRKAR